MKLWQSLVKERKRVSEIGMKSRLLISASISPLSSCGVIPLLSFLTVRMSKLGWLVVIEICVALVVSE